VWEGGSEINNGVKGGGGEPKKIWCVKGGSPKKIACKFRSESICNNANISGRRPKIAFLRTPYYIIHPTATLPHQQFHYKI